MQALIHESLLVYNLPWTLLLGLSLAYWLLTAIGLADLDFFDLDLDTESAHGDGDGDGEGNAQPGPLHGFFEFLHLTQLPLMVVLTALSATAWFFSVVGNHFLNAGANPWIGGAIAAAAFVPSAFVANVLLRPVVSFYRQLEAGTDGNIPMLGRTVTVRTDRVDENFGQGEVESPEGPLIINIRTFKGSETLKRGDTVFITEEDSEKMLYFVETFGAEDADLLGQPTSQPADTNHKKCTH